MALWIASVFGWSLCLDHHHRLDWIQSLRLVAVSFGDMLPLFMTWDRDGGKEGGWAPR